MRSSALTQRPSGDEHAPFYQGYVDAVPAGDVLATLTSDLRSASQLLAAVPGEREGYRYADGKWSVREVVGHVIDAERVFAYRALSFARGDAAPLPGMDEHQWMAGADFEARSLASLAREFEALRTANLELFASFDRSALDRRGVASDHPCTVRAWVYIVAGHARHHFQVLSERYLADSPA